MFTNALYAVVTLLYVHVYLRVSLRACSQTARSTTILTHINSPQCISLVRPPPRKRV